MAANKFVLKGSGVEVDYTIGANPAFPALVYKAVAAGRACQGLIVRRQQAQTK